MKIKNNKKKSVHKDTIRILDNNPKIAETKLSFKISF